MSEVKSKVGVPVTLLAGLQVFDIVLTYLLLSRGGVEVNPVSQFLLDRWLLGPVKLLIIGSVALYVWKREVSENFLLGLWFVCGVYTMVVVMNALSLNVVM